VQILIPTFDSGFNLKAGNISGSITSTGSFDYIYAGDFDVATVAGLVNLTKAFIKKNSEFSL
jgi:hypothetical protein